MTRKADLELLRGRLLQALDVVDPGEIPRISKELRAVDAELDVLGVGSSPGQQLVDQLKAKRERRTKTAG